MTRNGVCSIVVTSCDQRIAVEQSCLPWRPAGISQWISGKRSPVSDLPRHLCLMPRKPIQMPPAQARQHRRPNRQPDQQHAEAVFHWSYERARADHAKSSRQTRSLRRQQSPRRSNRHKAPLICQGSWANPGAQNQEYMTHRAIVTAKVMRRMSISQSIIWPQFSNIPLSYPPAKSPRHGERIGGWLGSGRVARSRWLGSSGHSR